ncbi:sigma-54-dependent transcriptional regulator FlbD [Kordiimonas aquimaris]|uniref:sigma-54-dependent transcriptional regulator FlbD n=1 Tax=Kordiimonas aquimaris TaxID=707591 RepID=UPI0021D00C09|nr:sigma-54 dependent transcriptional regulator [Kordiimonas aquimaris]
MRLLIVGTLNGQLGAASKIAMDRGAQVTHAPDADMALAILRNRGADLLMIEISLDIPSIIPKLRAEHFSIPVVACGIGTDPQTAAAAIRGGAKEYIPLPPDAELIAAVLEAVTEDSQSFIYRDAVMKEVAALAERIAPSEASVLITGESGTGKEVMARFVHQKSHRTNKPFVAVNCAAIPENLLESELFGHEKGAFTGAVARRIGKFEEADGGTLLLDEISEMDVRLQAKLLRAIQERQIDRVGGSKPVNVDIRIIATSNRNLQDAVKDGDFREDLFFRLNVFNLRVPPLRERPEDIAALAAHFAEKYTEVNQVEKRPISADAMNVLKAHAWPGNVRELENAMHRSVLLANGPDISTSAIMLPDASGNLTMPSSLSESTAGSSTVSSTDATDPHSSEDAAVKMVGKTVAEVERELIIDTLKHCLGNRTHAANILGISIRTLRNKLNQYNADGVPVPQPGDTGQRAPL